MTTKEERNKEKEKIMVTCFSLRSDDVRYEKFLEVLKSSTNCGRDVYPTTITSAFDLLVRESEEYDTVRGGNPGFRSHRHRGGRGKNK